MMLGFVCVYEKKEGGLTKMRGGIQACTLPAGYLGSSLIGALLIFAGFDTVASKVSVSFLFSFFSSSQKNKQKTYFSMDVWIFFYRLLVLSWL
jgi:hypothetical protein